MADVTKEAFALQYGFIYNPLLQRWVVDVGLRLSKSAGVLVNFYIVDTDEVNAYATFGNLVFLTKGLLEMVDSEDELACVLGHEIAHIKLKHPQKQTTLILLSSALLSSLDLKSQGRLLAKAVLALLNLGFSREQERKADDEGLKIALKSGFNPRGFISFIKKLGKEREPRWAQYLATHPSPEERIKICESALKNISDGEWRRIYLSLWERGEASEARELGILDQKPPPLVEMRKKEKEIKGLENCREKLQSVYDISKQITGWQNALLLAKISYEISLLAGEALAQRDRLEETYMESLMMYKKVNVYGEKIIQNEELGEIIAGLNSSIDGCKRAGEKLLLASAALSGLALCNRLDDTSLLSLQSLLIYSSYHLMNARRSLLKGRDILLEKGIEAYIEQLNELDNDWLRRKCAHRLGISLENLRGSPLGNVCLVEAVSKLLDKRKEEIEEMNREHNGNIGEILQALNIRGKNLEILSTFMGSLVRGN